MAISERVELAANYYEEKYGRVATLCFVHPSTLSEPSQIGRTMIKPMDTVQPNHFWLGVKPSGQALKASGQALIDLGQAGDEGKKVQ
jgi:hypothetical protein